jgi:hypothetical protein
MLPGKAYDILKLNMTTENIYICKKGGRKNHLNLKRIELAFIGEHSDAPLALDRSICTNHHDFCLA